MKRTLALLALAGFAGAALAQPQMPPPGTMGPNGHFRIEMRDMERWRMHQLTVLLDLTAAQQQQVKAILAREHVKMRQNMRRMMQQMRAAHRAARQETLAQLSHVLSPAQLTKYKVLMPRGPMMIMRHWKSRPMAPPAPPAAP